MTPGRSAGLPAALQNRRLVVVDVEGNGQSPPEIVEIAAIPIDRGHTEADMWSQLIRPRKPIAPMVTRKVHGIRNQDVAGCPVWDEVAGEVAGVLADRTLVAHNASVEYKVLSAHLPRWAPPMVLDTLRLARHVWPNLPGYGLDRLVAHADLDPAGFAESGHHRASYDAWCALQLLCRLVEDAGLGWNALVEMAALPSFTGPAEPEDGLW